MDCDTIRRGSAVGSAVGGGGTLTGDRGGEVPDIRYSDAVAAGPRLIGLRSGAKRLERVRAGQGTRPNNPARVGVTRRWPGDLIPPTRGGGEHDAAQPGLHGLYSFAASLECRTPYPK